MNEGHEDRKKFNDKNACLAAASCPIHPWGHIGDRLRQIIRILNWNFVGDDEKSRNVFFQCVYGGKLILLQIKHQKTSFRVNLFEKIDVEILWIFFSIAIDYVY